MNNKLGNFLTGVFLFALVATVICVAFGILFALMGYFGPVLGIIIFLLFIR